MYWCSLVLLCLLGGVSVSRAQQQTAAENKLFFEADASVSLSKIQNLYAGEPHWGHRIGGVVGWEFGATENIFAIKAGLYSITKGEGLKGAEVGYDAVNFWNIEIPFLATVKYPISETSFLGAEVGPFVSVGLAGSFSGKNKSLANIFSSSGAMDSFNRLDLGLTAIGSVYLYNNFKLQVGGDIGFLNRLSGENSKMAATARAYSVFMGVGYRF